MSLTTEIDSPPAPEMTPELREGMGLEFPHVTIRGINCAFGPKDDDYLYDRRFSYDIDIYFWDNATRDAFLSRPTLAEDAVTIAKTAEGALQSAFDEESNRDSNPEYADENPDEATMIAGITSGTQADIDHVLENEIKPIVTLTFFEAGIQDVRITDIRGHDTTCYPAMPGDTIGQVITDPAQQEQKFTQNFGRSMSLGL